MFNVSKDFAPPFGLIAPFFVAGVIFYLLSSIALLFYSADFSYAQIQVAGWVHLFLVGYVMMIIFGAMAQLVPVVLETGHFSVDWYYVIFPLLLVGTIGLIFGFWFDPILLSFGGVLVLAAMIIFAVDVFLTIKKTMLDTLTVRAVKVSNIFLLLGILSGFLMALTLSGFAGFDVSEILKAHLFAVVGGYVMITIFGISLVLLPMFGLAHGFSQKPIERAFKLMIISTLVGILAGLVGSSFLAILAFVGALGSTLLYLYQIYLIYKVQMRKERDIWFKSMVAGYGFLAFGVVMALLYLLSGGEELFLHAGFWALFCFFAYLINGHLYKIIPFLVWFHRYSALVGKQKVPMLHEMYPKRQAEYHFWFTLAGTLLIAIAMLSRSDEALKAGAAFLSTGALFLATSVRWMLRFKESR